MLARVLEAFAIISVKIKWDGFSNFKMTIRCRKGEYFLWEILTLSYSA